MIPFMPDLSAALPSQAAGGGMPQMAPTPGTPLATGIDFAGLLDAAMPSSPAPDCALPLAGLNVLPLAGPDAGPGGKILPVSPAQPGEELPPAVPLAVSVPLPLPVHLPIAHTVTRHADLSAPEPPSDMMTRADAELSNAAVTGGPETGELPAAAMPDPLTDQAAPDPALAAVLAPVPEPTPLLIPTLAPTPTPIPVLVAALPPPLTPPPTMPPAAGRPQGTAAARMLAAATPLSGRSPTNALPVLAPEGSVAPEPVPEEAAPAPAPALAALPAEPASAALAAAAPAPGTPVAPPPPAPPLAMPERIETPRAPAPQQESAIAQVGDLREALRAARPEMTLRHAEFGHVSLKLEATGTADWRAVLASRDPGFVPAIQAALAERAVAAASASAESGAFMGQNGTSEQRYGASPNGGQAGLSPYLGQSGGRDGEAAPDHRRTSTAAALAARSEGEEDHGSQTGQQSRGMFA